MLLEVVNTATGDAYGVSLLDIPGVIHPAGGYNPNKWYGITA